MDGERSSLEVHRRDPGAAARGSADGRSTIAACAAELAQSTDATHAIPRMLALAAGTLGACRVHILVNEPSADGLKPSRRYTWPPPPAEPGDAAFTAGIGTPEAVPLVARLKKGESVEIDARSSNGAFHQALAAQGVWSALIVPLVVDGRWWGETEIDRCSPERPWSDDDIETANTLTRLVGAALSRAQAEKEIADAARIIDNSATFLFRFAAKEPFPLTYVSQNITRYGYSAEQMLESPHLYLSLVHPEDLPNVMEDILRVSDGRSMETSRDLRMRAADGRYLWFDCRISAVRRAGVSGVAEIEGLAIDIDRRKTTESYIARFTNTDQLTGLASRAAFMDELRHTFTAARRGANPFAILYIDLDHFKDINDVLGHSKGDTLLKLVATRLQSAVRSGDFIARFGGDEFAVLQTDLTDPSDAGTLAARVLDEIRNPPYDLGTQIDVTASIGIAFFGSELPDAEEMIKAADMALYRAKDAGRNQFHFHSEALDVAVIERVTLASDLRRGLDRGEFELYYQPQVNARSGGIFGIEALARWHHPQRGLLLPSQFIPVAETSGAILALGRWVIDQVCRQIVAWRGDNLAPPTVSLNVSAMQMKSAPDFDSELKQILDTWQVEPRAIELELTESVLMTTTREHRDIIDRLNALGVAIAIDDFGTGYSSLGYLRAYRVSHIKIAQEFIRHIEEDSGDIAIVRAAISLARELGIKVIAEGVETAYQLRLLIQAGCPFVQGYYFSEPVPAARMGELLRQKEPFPSAGVVQDGAS